MQIHIHVPSQTLNLLDDAGIPRRSYTISTSKFGLGFEEGSNKTPTGRFEISEKIGDGVAAGMIFKGRVPTGKFGHEDDPADCVQTRILWLNGLEPQNANTKSRFIYIHGTNSESKLGTRASHGCVRMGNEDIIELYGQVAEGDPVIIEA